MIKKIILSLFIPYIFGCSNQLGVVTDPEPKSNSMVRGVITKKGNDIFTDSVTFQMVNESKDTLIIPSNMTYGDQNLIKLIYPEGRVHTISNGLMGPYERLLPGEIKNYPMRYVYFVILSNSLKENGKLKPLDGTHKLRWINKKYDIDIEEKIYFNLAEFQKRGY